MLSIIFSIISATALFGVILLPLFKSKPDKNKPVTYKPDTDTSDARYAINEEGCLQELPGKQKVGHYFH